MMIHWARIIPPPSKRGQLFFAVLMQILLSPMPRRCHAWTLKSPLFIDGSKRALRTTLYAKRNKRQTSSDDVDDLNRWYEAVKQDASPDDVFWEEMERQRLLNEIGATSDGGVDGSSTVMSNAAVAPSSNAMMPALVPPNPDNLNVKSSLERTNSIVGASYTMENDGLNGATVSPLSPKSIEATLMEYAAYAVPDNWLDDDLVAFNAHNVDDEEYDAPSLDEQLNAWEQQQDHDDEKDEDWSARSSPFLTGQEEPWDRWHDASADQQVMRNDVDEYDGVPRLDLSKAVGFFDDFETHLDDDAAMAAADQEEAATRARLAQLQIRSRRLERARANAKAAAYFAQPPDAMEGYDRVWVAAVDPAVTNQIRTTFRDYGVEFADNFGDFVDGCVEDGLASIEDVASFKARQVYNVTGLPCFAMRTSFEVEPVFAPSKGRRGGSGGGGSSAALHLGNPRVVSGYRFNDVGQHVDYITEALRAVSDISRVTRFRTCVCFYDGELEIFDYGVCDVDLIFSNSMRTFISASMAINEMLQTLQLTFGLEFQKWLQQRVDSATAGLGKAAQSLRDRVLRDGRVLPNDIIDVSDFMDSQVDVNLMDACAAELAQRFMSVKPNKILTVATTGLVLALPMAQHLQVPVVYARKERSIVMSDTYQAAYTSQTVGKNRELLVSKAHLQDGDRVLIIDDFLSSGSTQEALLRIVYESPAEPVGIGVLLEKVYDSGRQSLSGFDVPIHSLCRVASVQDGVIQLVEEEGFDRMQKKKAQGSDHVPFSG